MKPAVLRPQALRYQQGEGRYYRNEGGSRVAVKLVNATNAALDERQPQANQRSAPRLAV